MDSFQGTVQRVSTGTNRYRTIRWRPELSAGFTALDRKYQPRRQRGTPIVFDSDQQPVREINDWSTTLTIEVKPKTHVAYVAEVVRFGEFLWAEAGVGLTDPLLLERGDDLIREYALLCTKPDVDDHLSAGPVGDAKSTLGKRRAAIARFYDWHVREGTLERFPFATEVVQTHVGPVRTIRAMRGGRGASEEREAIPAEQVERFFDVGLAGRMPSGEPDPEFQRIETVTRSLAAAGLARATGMRHEEVLLITVFEIPVPDPDGLTPWQVPGAITKSGRTRRVVAFSDPLHAVWEYIRGERRVRRVDATWWPDRALEFDPTRTSSSQVCLRVKDGWVLRDWEALDLDQRRRLVAPGLGSPLLLLDQRNRNGTPIIGKDATNDAFIEATGRCAALWPNETWHFRMHHLRHTFATELIRTLREPEALAKRVRERTGRDPRWLGLAREEDPLLVAQMSLGHLSVETTAIYARSGLWDVLRSVNADPAHNPALDPTT